MTPQEKAKELVDRFIKPTRVWEQEEGWQDHILSAKQCALICAEEILQSEPRYPSDVDWDDAGSTFQYYYEAQREDASNFWQQVKEEIEKL